MDDNFDIKNELKKALHRSLAAAYHGGNKMVKKAIDTSDSTTLKGIVHDLKNPDPHQEVDSSLLPVDKEAVLTKDADKKEPNAIAQAHDISEDQKKAALGMNTKPETHVKQPRALVGFMANRAGKMEKANPDRIGTSNEKGVHLRSIIPHKSHVSHEDKTSSQTGDEVRSAINAPRSRAIGNAKANHSKVLGELKAQPKPNLGKARVDEGMNLEDKVRERQSRNNRTVKVTKTPSGQPNRTQRAYSRRANELEVGPAVYDKPDAEGRPMRVRGIPTERRMGEKIIGTPRTMQTGERDPSHTSAEATYGVHMHSGSMAGKDLPVGGGRRSAAPVHANREGKSYTVGGGAGGPNMTAKLRHNAVQYGQNKIQPNLGKSESRKGFAVPHPQPKSPEKNILETGKMPMGTHSMNPNKEPSHEKMLGNKTRFKEVADMSPYMGKSTDGIASAKHGLKAAVMKVKHEHEKAHLASQKPQKQSMQKAKVDEGKPWGEKRRARKETRENGIHIKGVRPSLDSGVSHAGAAIRSIPKHPDNLPYGIEKPSLKGGSVRRIVEGQHHKTMGELKQMPKPNLGKARVDEGKPSSEKIQMRNERNDRTISGGKITGIPKSIEGVHKPMTRTSGNSKAGMHAKSAANVKPYKDHSGETRIHPRKAEDVARARGYHSDVRHEMKNQPKPNLGKDEADGGMIGGLAMSQKGVHKPLHSDATTKLPQDRVFHVPAGKKGTSINGVSSTKALPGYAPNIKGQDRTGRNETARKGHEKVLSELKSMPKPNLGKDEGEGTQGLDGAGMMGMQMSEHKPKSPNLLRKIAVRMKSKRLTNGVK